MNTKIAAMATLAVCALTLTGCGGREGYDDSGWRSENIATPNGTITCVLFDGYDSDAISCDWGSK